MGKFFGAAAFGLIILVSAWIGYRWTDSSKAAAGPSFWMMETDKEVCYVVLNRWDTRRVVFHTAKEDGRLTYVSVQKLDDSVVLLYPDKVIASTMGRFSRDLLDWKTWADRFVTVKQEATSKPAK